MKTLKVKNEKKLKQNLFLIAVFAIPTIHFLVFWLYTNINSILLAFQNRSGEFVGLENFEWYLKDIFSVKPTVKAKEGLINSLKFWLFNQLVETPVALAIAYFFFKKIKGASLFNVILFLPSIISSVVMTTVFKNFLSSAGPLATLFEALGVSKFPYLLYNSKYAMNTMLFYNFWTGFGTALILYTSSMRKIPPEIFEAAMLDGAGMWKEFTNIVWPLIWPMFSTMLMLSIGNIFTSSGPILLLTNGEYGTQTISHTIFQQYYEYNQIERSAAIGLFYSFVALPLVLITRWLVNKLDSNAEY